MNLIGSCCNRTASALAAVVSLPKTAVEYLGKKLLTHALASQLDSIVEIDSFSLSLLGSQKLRGVKISNADYTISAKEMEVEFPSWQSIVPSKLCCGRRKPVPVDFGFKLSQSSLTLPQCGKGTVSNISGKVSKDALTLREAVRLEFQFAPGADKMIAGKMNPLFINGVQTKKPISLRLAAEDFSIPVREFSLENLKIGNGVLDLGEMDCENGPTLSWVLKFLKTEAKMTNVKSTPIAFHLDRGVLSTERMDVLFDDSIHVCTWGSVDLVKDQIDMRVGLPAPTLKKSLGISNLLPEDVLQLPIRGTSEEPLIEGKAAAAKIAALYAKSKVDIGFLNGYIAHYMPVQEELKAPAPKRPFPWELG